ncbi:MAG: lipid-A-disaccharide synthase, partial [Candidatus Omnitrophota bacterium]
MKHAILISAGERSGDIHAANLVGNLKKLNPDLDFFGIGGGKMGAQGVDLVERMDKLSIIGLSGIVSNLGRIRSIYKRILDRVKKDPPRAAILVDYPGFNLILARALKKRGIPVIYYITPQVWAWGAFRIRSIKKYVDKAIVILAFEEKIFQNYGINATFVGHPILDGGKDLPEVKLLGLDENKTTVALLPGSRAQEVKNLLPLMLEAAGLISKEKSVQFVLLESSGVSNDIYEAILKKYPISPALIKDNTRGCLSIADFVLTASGTATLECAIMERPALITYKLSFLSFVLAKIFAKTKTPIIEKKRRIGLVNIIAGKVVLPEILQYSATPRRLASEVLSIISSKEKMERQIEELRRVKNALGSPGASFRAARIVN